MPNIKVQMSNKVQIPKCQNIILRLSHWDLGFNLTSGFWHLTFIIIILCLWFSPLTFAQESNPPVIALSLQVLQQQVQSGKMSADLMQLGGIKKIEGFVVDAKNHDVILFGTSGSGTPLFLDDFVTALRSVMIDNAPPGCSIDPTETTLLRIRKFNQNFSMVTSTTAADAILEDFKRIGAEPQNVRVMTVPHNSHFAQIMVTADYYTKRISNGTALTDLKGFKSLSAMATEKLQQDVTAGKHPQLTMYNRFWFTPGTVQFSPDNEIVRLTQCEVKLLTEQEFLNPQGKLVGSGTEQPMAQAFVQEFTKRYDEIAAAAPMFADLKSLFRFVAIAKGLQYDSAFSTAGINMDYLLNKYPVNPARVPQTLPGITEIKKIEIKQKNQEIYLWLLSFGGVDMDIKIDPKSWKKSTGGISVESKPSGGKPAPGKPQVSIESAHGHAHDTTKQPAGDAPVPTKDKILRNRPARDSLKWTISR
jgi:hypothetical protein